MGTGGAWRVLAGAALVATTVVAPAGGPSASSGRAIEADSTCEPGPAPFAETPGADLQPEVHTSKDADPATYVLWRGTVPSFDGLPLSVDVTLPCGPTEGALPTVTVLHGFTDDKTVWEETGKSDTVESPGRPGSNARWNNIWFASRGYATLTYTARGWRDSCGPDTPGATASTPAPQCADHEYWIHLDDKRWEVRDAQWLTAGLVQSGTADPGHLAITGGSYGGAPTASAALLADRVVCGADPVPAELGDDPCAGAADGDLVPWTTADGDTPLTWAAALPLYTFSDLLRVLAPNGRWTDATLSPEPDTSSTDPFGAPLESTVSGLVLAGSAFGAFAPRGEDPDSDILTTTDRLLAGDPYDPADPVVDQGIDVYERFKSPITTEPQGQVPIFWVQGFNDALFPGSEALAMVDHLREADPDYPIKVFLGDIGHDYAAEQQDDWDLVKAQMNDFLDHYLFRDRTPTPPTFDVGASFVRCFDPQATQTYVTAASWADLQGTVARFTSDEVGTTSTADQGASGVATDPISTATLGGENSYKGCRIMSPVQIDQTTAAYEFPIEADLFVLGAPTIELELTTTGPDAPIAVRLWDMAEDGSAQALVTRGVYRMTDPAADPITIRFQLWPQAYRLEEGHTLKVEITGNDSPYLLANNQASEITVSHLELRLPSSEELQPKAPKGDVDSRMAGSNAVVAVVLLLVPFVVVFGGLAIGRRRRSRRAPHDSSG